MRLLISFSSKALEEENLFIVFFSLLEIICNDRNYKTIEHTQWRGMKKKIREIFLCTFNDVIAVRCGKDNFLKILLVHRRRSFLKIFLEKIFFFSLLFLYVFFCFSFTISDGESSTTTACVLSCCCCFNVNCLDFV